MCVYTIYANLYNWTHTHRLVTTEKISNLLSKSLNPSNYMLCNQGNFKVQNAHPISEKQVVLVPFETEHAFVCCFHIKTPNKLVIGFTANIP